MTEKREKRKGSFAATCSTIRERIIKGKPALVVEEWVRMFQPNWRAIALDRELGRTDLRVLLLCATGVGPRQRIIYTQREIAEQLGITAPVVNRAMRILVEKGLILQEGHALFLNSRVATDERSISDLIIQRKKEVGQLHKMSIGVE